jgi:RNA polymerase primary sigma factor
MAVEYSLTANIVGSNESEFDPKDPELLAIVKDSIKIAPVSNSPELTDNTALYLSDMNRGPLLNGEQELDLGRRVFMGNMVRHIRGQKRFKYAIPLPKDRSTYTSIDFEKAHQTGQIDLERIEEEGKLAGDELIDKNLRLVFSTARRYQDKGLTLLELVQEGNIGLIKSARGSYDYRMGFRFSTYATWWIRQSMIRALADQARLVRLPVHVGEVIRKALVEEQNLRQENGTEPSSEQIAERLGLKPERLKEIMGAPNPISLETPINEEDDTLADLVPGKEKSPHDQAVHAILKDRIAEVLGTLDIREQQVLDLVFGLTDEINRPMEEVGERLGISRERVRQIRNKALIKLRHPSRSKMLRDFVDD